VERGKIPKSVFEFAFDNIGKELFQKRYGFRKDPYETNNNEISSHEDIQVIRRRRMFLKRLHLKNDNIWMRETQREIVPAPRPVLVMYYGVCFMLDFMYDKKPIDRFWFLETVARMPYFSYVTTLHMYETLGWWEIDGNLKRVHLDEEINEAAHLRVMESIGGDSLWWNRLLARHGAVAYYVMLMVLFMVSPRLAYMCSELLELHAVDTYEEFCESNEQVLKEMPLTSAALEYDPSAQTFYDVFMKIARDEKEHANTMYIVRNLNTD
jgi:ubiquinol oxidase